MNFLSRYIILYLFFYIQLLLTDNSFISIILKKYPILFDNFSNFFHQLKELKQHSVHIEIQRQFSLIDFNDKS